MCAGESGASAVSGHARHATGHGREGDLDTTERDVDRRPVGREHQREPLLIRPRRKEAIADEIEVDGIEERERMRTNRGAAWWFAWAAAASLVAACANKPSPVQGSVTAHSSDAYSIAVVASTVQGLPKCTSSAAGTTAYVQSPVNIYACRAGLWVPIP